MTEVCHALHDGFVRRHSATSDAIVLMKAGIDARNFLPLFFIFEPIGHRRNAVAVIPESRVNPFQPSRTRIEVVRREMRVPGVQRGHVRQRLVNFLQARRRAGISTVCWSGCKAAARRYDFIGAHHEQRVVGPKKAGLSPAEPPPPATS